MSYYNIGAKASYSSLNLDSTEFYYDFDIYYNYFHQSSYLFQHNVGLDGIMAKSFKGYYVGSGLSYEHYSNSDSIGLNLSIHSITEPVSKEENRPVEF